MTPIALLAAAGPPRPAFPALAEGGGMPDDSFEALMAEVSADVATAETAPLDPALMVGLVLPMPMPMPMPVARVVDATVKEVTTLLVVVPTTNQITLPAEQRSTAPAVSYSAKAPMILATLCTSKAPFTTRRT